METTPVAIPGLRVSPAALDLGSGLPGEVLSGTFEIFNDGPEPVPYELSRSCSCTTLRPQSGSLPSGGRVRVETSVTLPAASGGRTPSRIGVRRDGAGAEIAAVEVIGRCPRLFRLSDDAVPFQDPSGEVDPAACLTVECAAAGLSFTGEPSVVTSAGDGLEIRVLGGDQQSVRFAVLRWDGDGPSSVTLRVFAEAGDGRTLPETFVVRDASSGGLVLSPSRLRGRGPFAVVARVFDGRPVRFVTADGGSVKGEAAAGTRPVNVVTLRRSAGGPTATTLRFKDERGQIFEGVVEFSD